MPRTTRQAETCTDCPDGYHGYCLARRVNHGPNRVPNAWTCCCHPQRNEVPTSWAFGFPNAFKSGTPTNLNQYHEKRATGHPTLPVGVVVAS